jgi:hypothetical protein
MAYFYVTYVLCSEGVFALLKPRAGEITASEWRVRIAIEIPVDRLYDSFHSFLPSLS